MKTIVHYGNKRRKQVIAKQERELLKKLGERKEGQRELDTARMIRVWWEEGAGEKLDEYIEKLESAPAQPQPRGSEALRELALEAATRINAINQARGHVLKNGYSWDHIMPTEELAGLIEKTLLAAATAERTPLEAKLATKMIRWGFVLSRLRRSAQRVCDEYWNKDGGIKTTDEKSADALVALRDAVSIPIDGPPAERTPPQLETDPEVASKRIADMQAQSQPMSDFERGWQAAIEAAAQIVEKDAKLVSEIEKAKVIRSLRPSPAPQE